MIIYKQFNTNSIKMSQPYHQPQFLEYNSHFSNTNFDYIPSTFITQQQKQQQSWYNTQKNLKNILKDIFPYYKLHSLTTIVIIISITVYVFIPKQYTIIRPYFRYNFDLQNVLAWMLCPFCMSQFVEVVVHSLYMMVIGAELEYKLDLRMKISNISNKVSNNVMEFRKVYFVMIYVMACLIGNLIAVLCILPISCSISSNLPSYCLYGYLQYLDQEIHMKLTRQLDSIEEIGIDYNYKIQKQEFQQQFMLVRIYKTIIISYCVFVGQYGNDYRHFQCYIGGIVIIAVIVGMSQFNKAKDSP